jgi:hypothetical protein
MFSSLQSFFISLLPDRVASTAFKKKEEMTTIRASLSLHCCLKTITELSLGTNKYTKVDRKIRYIFPDGKEICSEVSSKTTFAANTRRKGQHVQPFDTEAMAILLEAMATSMGAAAAEEVEQEVSNIW